MNSTHYMEEYRRWLASPALSDEDRDELRSIEGNTDEIKARFSGPLTFGTAGLRGKMKVGLGNMNRYTVAWATAGLAALINREGRAKDGVVIAYDCRYHSEEFARTAAVVLAASGIQVFLFDALRPTPELSFALRQLGCVAGINITASHNPKEYNGYKAYWEDGAQLPPEHADTVAQSMLSLDIFDDVPLCEYAEAIADDRIRLIGTETDEDYLAHVLDEAVDPESVHSVADELRIVYTPLHGTGHKLVPTVLRRLGLTHVYTVAEQMRIDGGFPTVEKPNPEYAVVFEKGIELANRVGSDLVIATDPDADRVGVVSRCKDGTFRTITGNQMGALLLDYILTAYEQNEAMPAAPYAVKTIVTSALAERVCHSHGVEMFNVLTGFKFIGEVIKKHEEKGHGTFIFGFEESYGYLKGTYARDKDAVVASMLIAEMAAFYYRKRGMTLCDALDGLFARYGYAYETNVELYMEGVDGAAKMEALMDSLRNTPPADFDGTEVVEIRDYLKNEILDVETGIIVPTGLPKSNVLYYRLSSDDVIVARPSGTEPKVKFYYLLSGTDEASCKAKCAAYQKSLQARI